MNILTGYGERFAASEQPAHAKSRPPSGALRWINCPASPNVVPLYPNDESIQSNKGTEVHYALELGIRFGIKPDTQDPDADMNVIDVLDWIEQQKFKYGSECQVYAEQRYDIEETGEFGTCDITFVTPLEIHIADYKNGYVFTDAYEQLMMYLLGAIQKFGERSKYKITVIQPNHDHIDGPYRTLEVPAETVELFRMTVKEAVAANHFAAGPWCKKSYCPHRGGCATFNQWLQETGEEGYYTHEINSISDDELAKQLDFAEVLQGMRDERRKEAMRRIMQHNRSIRGYKMVKSRQQRDFAGDAGRAACYRGLLLLGYTTDDLSEREPYAIDDITLYKTAPLTVADVERLVKQKYKHFKRGTWKIVWDEHFAPHIRSFTGSLTLERETDGRPSHKPGSEFGQASIPAQPVLSLGPVQLL